MIAADRVLLELAAKAAGAPWPVRGFDYGGDDRAAAVLFEVGALAPFRWNPLTDDGDALRLAVKLQLTVCNEHVQAGQAYCTRGDEVFPSVYSGTECDGPADDHVIPGDFSATRSAIVLAAAAIGRAMP